ncbi:hypothetical protein EsH8_XI_000063 [Colletotrichum jinshuiense]
MPRQRIETEADVAAELFQPRRVAHVYFYPDVDKTWHRSAATEECRKRFDVLKSNLGYQPVEHVFLVFGIAVAKSWTALKTINSLADSNDKAKRKTDTEIRAAINATAATRHANSVDDAESVAVEWTPDDAEAAFRGTFIVY